jgi:methyl-accepting chemotaxis protein
MARLFGIGDARVISRIGLLCATAALGFLLFAPVAYGTMSTVKVGGPIYNNIVQGKDVIADVLPPPEYVIESYLISFQLVNELERGADRATLDGLVQRGRTLRRDYDDRHEFWVRTLPESPLRQRLLVASYNPAVDFYTIRDQELVPAILAGDLARAKQTLGGPLKQRYEEHRAAVDQVVALAGERNAQDERNAAALIQQRTVILIGIGLAVLAVGAVIGFVVLRSVAATAARVSSAVGELTATSTGLMSATADLSSGASEQSAAINQTTATVNEVLASAEQAVELGKNVTTTAEQARSVANEGVHAVREAIEGINTLRQKVQSIADDIMSLSERSQQIGDIVSAVSDMADQSNLLALNASIEASRAGEHGKGFAVVAREMRALAEQSKAATAQVRVILMDTQRATNTAVMATEQGIKGVDAGALLVEQAGRTIDELAEVVLQASQSVAQINASVRQHSIGMDQIAAAMSDINRATYQSLGVIDSTKQAAENLSQLASSLNTLVTKSLA